MNKRIRSVLFCVALTAQLPSQGATGNWAQVENLAPGTPISVVTRHRIHCQFESAADDGLSCSVHSRISLFFTISRDEIQEVALEESNASHVAVGALIGGGLGAALGALHNGNRNARGAAAFLGAGLGALIGGSVGKAIPPKHGPILYAP